MVNVTTRVLRRIFSFNYIVRRPCNDSCTNGSKQDTCTPNGCSPESIIERHHYAMYVCLYTMIQTPLFSIPTKARQWAPFLSCMNNVRWHWTPWLITMIWVRSRQWLPWVRLVVVEKFRKTVLRSKMFGTRVRFPCLTTACAHVCSKCKQYQSCEVLTYVSSLNRTCTDAENGYTTMRRKTRTISGKYAFLGAIGLAHWYINSAPVRAWQFTAR